ncbi:hypothetical protein [Chamaesiphon sp. VAR_69_metabat_338]|uniref:hypothetical protein n=1 Tax=Chamaesiphon sp. VAR_69_metabat_338 TaxID=2964704 RepID=UPI00286E8164|nr:hypothetical protein [Chamaesiphon sp. VAR_69_metabat_338]
MTFLLFDLLEFTALIISIAIESLVVSIWGIYFKLEWRLLAIVAAMSTAITHPILWQACNHALLTNNDIGSAIQNNYFILSLEIWVTIFEGWIYKLVMKYSWRSSLLIAGTANLSSYLFGIFYWWAIDRRA